MRVAEERFVLPDWFALVVEDGPATAHPSGVNFRPAFLDCPRLSLYLLLDLAPKTVGIGEADLDFQSCGRERVAEVRLACDARCKRRLAKALETLQVVDDAGRRVLQEAGSLTARVSEEAIDLARCDIWYETRQ